MWVKGHSRVEGNKRVDRRAKDPVMRGQWKSELSLVTIRQAYPLFQRSPHFKWDRRELRGLTYEQMDRGTQQEW